MNRRLGFTLLLIVFCASTAWPKIKKQEQEYLDSQFQALAAQVGALQEQIKTVKNQVETLGKQLTELQKTQGELRDVVMRQGLYLQSVDQSVNMTRMSHDENFNNLKAALNVVRAQQEKIYGALTNQPPISAALGTTEAVASPMPSGKVVEGYVSDVQGDVITIGLGSAQGLHTGSRLAVYKAADRNTRVGELEITAVVSAGVSHAKTVTGVRPEFSDIVRIE